MKNLINYSSCLLSVLFLYSCHTALQKLPFLGISKIDTVQTSAGVRIDSVYAVIPRFSFIDQDSQIVNNKTFKGKIYIADFFFTSCPTICPVMQKNLRHVYQAYVNDNSILFLSHTIDPDHDTPEILRKYAGKLEVSGPKWRFVTGKKEEIYAIAEKGYMSFAKNDDVVNGGYIHSGGLILVDRNGHIRGVYDGTDEISADKLISDIKTLEKER